MKLIMPAISWLVRLLLAAFFGFVGYWKAFGPIAALAEHHAWVAGFPTWFARAAGWQELLCAAALLTPAFPSIKRVPAIAAIALIINQLAALGVHVWRGEAQMAAPQNLVLITLLSFVAFRAHIQGSSAK